jgi:pyruvate formate lyase activating enzyme
MSIGLIFDIKRFSIHDGPGIRSTVFLKGCPLSCQWCHNPESQSYQPELIFRSERCLACGDCVDACPHEAARLVNGRIQQNWDLCQLDGSCILTCFPAAREIVGREVTAEEVVEELVRDRVFYEQSGGGVTFSGGEPLAQPGFLEDCLRLSKKAGLSTALDTCGSGSWENLERQLPYLDLVLYDLKILDDKLHQDYTGISNREILDNFKRLVASENKVQIRRPLIPGVNDSEEEIERLGKFLSKIKGENKIDLLPYHALSADKYKRLGRKGREWQIPSKDLLDRISQQLVENGFIVGLRG